MISLLYTTTDKIRAILGVTERELADKQVEDVSVVERTLLKLKQVYPDHADLASKISGGTATDDEKSTWSILNIYCDYLGASFLLPQIQMLVFKRVSDEAATVHRYGPDDLQSLRDQILGALDEYEDLLNPDLADAWMPVNVFGTVRPTYDPVTNEGAEGT